MLYVKEKETGKIHKVWKYLLSGDEQQNIWCHDWYGHHVIGDDCVFAKSVEYSSNHNNKPLVKADVSGSLLLEQDNDIDVVGNCPNCGVEFHIHKQ